MVTRCCKQFRCLRYNWPKQTKKKAKKPPTPSTKPQPPALESFANKCWHQSPPGVARLTGDWAGMLQISDWDDSWTRGSFHPEVELQGTSEELELPRTITGLGAQCQFGYLYCRQGASCLRLSSNEKFTQPHAEVQKPSCSCCYPRS